MTAPKHPDDLAHHASVRLLSVQGNAVPWRLMRGKTVWEQVPPGRLALNSPDMIQQLMLDGAGIGALPCRFAAEDVRLKRLIQVLPAGRCPSFPPGH